MIIIDTTTTVLMSKLNMPAHDPSHMVLHTKCQALQQQTTNTPTHTHPHTLNTCLGLSHCKHENLILFYVLLCCCLCRGSGKRKNTQKWQKISAGSAPIQSVCLSMCVYTCVSNILWTPVKCFHIAKLLGILHICSTRPQQNTSPLPFFIA